MVDELDRAYVHCQRVAKEHAKNFYYAFRALPSRKRNAIYATYAVCRLWDDIADEDDIPIEQKRRLFSQARSDLTQVLTSVNVDVDSKTGRTDLQPEFVALADAVRAFRVPERYFTEILTGVESDLTKTRFANFSELREYCYGVASAVGLICIEIFGHDDPRAEGYAIDMGIALQLTNILRDIKEDSDRGRIYLPQDELAQFGYAENDLMRQVYDERFKSLMRYQVARARSYYERSRPLFELIEPESRTCLRVLHAAYLAILNRIERSDYDVFSGRIGLTSAEKLMIAARLWISGVVPTIPGVRRFHQGP